MNRRRFLQLSTATGLCVGSTLRGRGQSFVASRRGCLVYIDIRLAAEDFFQRLIKSATTCPLLNALSGGGNPGMYATHAPAPLELAFNNVIVIALPDDPILVSSWQRESILRGAVGGREGSIYSFGFGNIEGAIGYVESDRNPFLHSAEITKAPFEAQWISVTGTDRDGIRLALDALLNQGLVNGIVAAPGWKRGELTLLDRDPLSPHFAVPAFIPEVLGSLERIAITQCAEDEYRGAFADTRIMPNSIWQAKFYSSGQWDSAGQIASFHHYSVGLHRRAYGNSIWAAEFSSPAEARLAASRIATAANMRTSGDRWQGSLPSYAWGLSDMGDAASTGELELYVADSGVLLSAQSRAV